jgi:hypothetical protein
MLEVARREDLDLATNVPVLGADTLWVHLLPSLTPRHVVWFGVPDPHAEALLAGAHRTSVIEFDPPPPWPRPPWGAARAHRDVCEDLARLDAAVDLAIVPPRAATSIGRDPDLLRALIGVLAPQAVVHLPNEPRLAHRMRHRNAMRRLTRALGDGTAARLSSVGHGREASATLLSLPIRKTATLRRTRARLRQGASLVTARAARTAGLPASRLSRSHPSDIRVAHPVPVGRSGSPAAGPALLRRGAAITTVPGYLHDLATRSGIDLSDARWGVAPLRGFRSQKVIFALTYPGADLIVKMTQEPRFNARLDNERRALDLLSGLPVATTSHVPRVVFSDTHAGLLVVAETALSGRPFRACSTGTAACPLARSAVAWLTELGAATVDRGETRGPLLGPIQELIDRYLATFDTPSIDRRVLHALMGALAERHGEVPAVMSHGDPGTWNLLASTDGRIGFLDWENAEDAGVPGWDLLLFFKTFASFVTETAGSRPTPDRVLAQLCHPGPFNRLVRESFHTYADRLAIDAELLPALALTCWIHQALKEASRQTPENRDRSRSRRIVARCLAEPELLSRMTAP